MKNSRIRKRINYELDYNSLQVEHLKLLILVLFCFIVSLIAAVIYVYSMVRFYIDDLVLYSMVRLYIAWLEKDLGAFSRSVKCNVNIVLLSGIILINGRALTNSDVSYSRIKSLLHFLIYRNFWLFTRAEDYPHKSIFQ